MEQRRKTDHSKISEYWEKYGVWSSGVLLAMCAFMFTEQKTRIDQIEAKVQVLQEHKVSRQELKDMEDRLYNRMDGMKADIILHISTLRESSKK